MECILIVKYFAKQNFAVMVFLIKHFEMSEPGSDGNDGVLCIPQSSSITGASVSDSSVSSFKNKKNVKKPYPIYVLFNKRVTELIGT